MMIKTTADIEYISYEFFHWVKKKEWTEYQHKEWVDKQQLLELINMGLNSSMKNNKGFVFALERLKVHLGVDEK